MCTAQFLLYECPHKLFDIFLKSYRVQKLLFFCLGERSELYVEFFVRQALFFFFYKLICRAEIKALICPQALLYLAIHRFDQYRQYLLDY